MLRIKGTSSSDVSLRMSCSGISSAAKREVYWKVFFVVEAGPVNVNPPKIQKEGNGNNVESLQEYRADGGEVECLVDQILANVFVL